MPINLFLGGASSGKTLRAMEVAHQDSQQKRGSLFYLATAKVLDDEMQNKALNHQKQREGQAWTTMEISQDIVPFMKMATAEDVIVLDSSSMWLSNILLAEIDHQQATNALYSYLEHCVASLYIVADEVGCGIVPENALARRFRIINAECNQRLAKMASRVELLHAGLVQTLKS